MLLMGLADHPSGWRAPELLPRSEHRKPRCVWCAASFYARRTSVCTSHDGARRIAAPNGRFAAAAVPPWLSLMGRSATL